MWYARIEKMEVLKVLLPYVQMLAAILLVVVILLQQKGTGLGAAFGGEGNIYQTKRGFEQILFTSSIILASLFFITAILNLVI